MNPIGMVAGMAAFLGIWVGHVAVRKAEATSPSIWFPAVIFVFIGALLQWLAFSAHSPLVSAASGIVGVTFFWDAFEMRRQENRVQKGHAPANPANPRHRKMLDAPGTRATTRDLLKREALGRGAEFGDARNRMDL